MKTRPSLRIPFILAVSVGLAFGAHAVATGGPSGTDDDGNQVAFEPELARMHATVRVQSDTTLRVREALRFEVPEPYDDEDVRSEIEFERRLTAGPELRLDGTAVLNEIVLLEIGGEEIITIDRTGDADYPDEAVSWRADRVRDDGTVTNSPEFELAYRVDNVSEAYDDVVIVQATVFGATSRTARELTASMELAAPASGDGKPLRTWVRPGGIGVVGSPDADGRVSTRPMAAPRNRPVVISAMYPRSAFKSVAGATVFPGNGRERVIAEQEAAVADAGGASGAWVVRHGTTAWAVVVGALALVLALLLLLTRARRFDVPRQLGAPPEAASPAVAYGLATDRRAGDRLVLPTFLDLLDRGYYAGQVGLPEAEPGAEPVDAGAPRHDLIVALPAQRPSTSSLLPGELAVLSFFDDLIGNRPGALGSMLLRLPPKDKLWSRRWNEMASALADAAEPELVWERDLRGLRWAALATALALLGVLALVGRTWSDSLAWLVPAVPLVLGVGLALPSSSLRRLAPEPGLRRARWRAFAAGLRDESVGGRAHFGRPEWARVLLLGIAFDELGSLAQASAVRSVAGPAAAVGQPAVWWAGLATVPLAFLADSAYGSSWGTDCATYLAAPSSSDGISFGGDSDSDGDGGGDSGCGGGCGGGD